MSKFKRLTTSLRSQGVATTLFKLRLLLFDHWFDFRYGLDTCSWSELDELTIVGDNKARGYRYQPARVLILRKLFRSIQPMIPANGALVDFGSGKGRVLLIASEFGFLRVCGVEFAHELCEAARKNCVKFKAIKNVRTEFQTVETDAAKYTVGADESVFVLYNPFDGAILDKVLDNIAISLQQQPRKILIVYYNPRWHHVIEQRNDFTRLRELSFWGYAFTLYSNRH